MKNVVMAMYSLSRCRFPPILNIKIVEPSPTFGGTAMTYRLHIHKIGLPPPSPNEKKKIYALIYALAVQMPKHLNATCMIN